MKIFLDDVREPKVCFGYKNDRVYLEDGWLTVKNYDEFVKAIQEHWKDITHISFDHDLAQEHLEDLFSNENWDKHDNLIKLKYETYTEKTGLDCAKWLLEYSQKDPEKVIQILVHSQNPVGRKNIQDLFIHG